jgi:hypothetical protein
MLRAIERQVTTTWIEVDGEVTAAELFPNLLPESESFIEYESNTEEESDDGRYDGCPQDVPEGCEEEATAQAEEEFHAEALAAARKYLQAHSSILRKSLEDREVKLLEAAAADLGISVPWDVAEAAQIAADQAALEARKRAYEAQQQVFKQLLLQFREKHGIDAPCNDCNTELLVILDQAADLLRTGNAVQTVQNLFPKYKGQIANLVGPLRKRGVVIPSVARCGYAYPSPEAKG